MTLAHMDSPEISLQAKSDNNTAIQINTASHLAYSKPMLEGRLTNRFGYGKNSLDCLDPTPCLETFLSKNR